MMTKSHNMRQTRIVILVFCCMGFMYGCNTFTLPNTPNESPSSDVGNTITETNDILDPGLNLTPSIDSTSTPTNTITLTPPPSLTPIGVTSNAEWEPHIEEFTGVMMALVPVGCFVMGSTDEQIDYVELLHEESGTSLPFNRSAYSTEQPAHQICFTEPFWIDTYEVTNEQFSAFLKDTGKDSTASLEGGWSVNTPLSTSGYEKYPVLSVTWYEASEYCQWRGARLPTEAEWEYAARGPDALIFPWGNEFISENLVFSTDPMTGYGEDNDQPREVGSAPGGVSWVGVYDMSGNAIEWMNDWIDHEYYSTLPIPSFSPIGPEDGEAHVLRGGGWDTDWKISLRAADRYGSLPGSTTTETGFRCARDDSP